MIPKAEVLKPSGIASGNKLAVDPGHDHQKDSDSPASDSPDMDASGSESSESACPPVSGSEVRILHRQHRGSLQLVNIWFESQKKVWSPTQLWICCSQENAQLVNSKVENCSCVMGAQCDHHPLQTVLCAPSKCTAVGTRKELCAAAISPIYTQAAKAVSHFGP